jgi:hypothetical protein
MRGGGSVPSKIAGKVAAGIAGVTGTGTLGLTVATFTQVAGAHAVVPAGIWLVLALAVGAVMMAGLSLILNYRQKKLEIESGADLQKTRQEMYRILLEKSAGEPESAASYQALILADALHLTAEQNSVRPADRMHG